MLAVKNINSSVHLIQQQLSLAGIFLLDDAHEAFFRPQNSTVTVRVVQNRAYQRGSV